MSSFTFNNVNLNDYDLIVITSDFHVFSQSITLTQLQDYAIPGAYKWPARTIRLSVIVRGDSVTDIIAKLDNIKKVLATTEDKPLILDIINTRYWNARLKSFDGEFKSITVWSGKIDFVCTDPAAYATTETQSQYTIDTDPETVTETAGGTSFASPVFTLTAGADVPSATIVLENTTTAEALTWAGDLETGDKLEIDTAHWIVKLNGTASMSGVSGQFPRLQPGANSIKVTGLSAGTLDIVYRARYL